MPTHGLDPTEAAAATEAAPAEPPAAQPPAAEAAAAEPAAEPAAADEVAAAPASFYEAPAQASFTFEEASAPAPANAPIPDGAVPAKLFLGGLEWNTNEDGIRGYFSQFCTVVDCMVLRERENPSKSRGFGFVTISDESKVEQILASAHELDGRTLTVRRAAPKGNNDPTRPGSAMMAQANQAPLDGTEKKIFLGGLTSMMDEAAVRAACGQYGTIVDVQMMNNEQQAAGGRGFGFVSFTESAPAQNLIQLGTLEVAGATVNVQRAQPKGQRRNNFGGGCGGRGGGYGGNVGGYGGYGGNMGGRGGYGGGMGGGMGMGGGYGNGMGMGGCGYGGMPMGGMGGNCGYGGMQMGGMGGCGGYGGGQMGGGQMGGGMGGGQMGGGMGGGQMGGGMGGGYGGGQMGGQIGGGQMGGQMGMGGQMNMGGNAMYGQQGGMPGGDGGGYGPQRTDRNFQRPGPY